MATHGAFAVELRNFVNSGISVDHPQIGIGGGRPVHISAVTWRLMALVYCLVDNDAVTQSTTASSDCPTINATPISQTDSIFRTNYKLAVNPELA